MSHFAKVENGVVTQVIVAEQDVIDSGLFGDPKSWVQTSYNTRDGIHLLGGTPLRKNFAGIGYTYDQVKDEFNPPADIIAPMETVTVIPSEPVITLETAPETITISTTASDTITL